MYNVYVPTKTNVLTRIFTKLTYKRLIYFCRLSDHYDSSFWKRQPYHMTSYFCNIFCGVFIYMYLSSYCFFLKHRCSYFHVFLYNCSKIITKSVFISAREKKKLKYLQGLVLGLIKDIFPGITNSFNNRAHHFKKGCQISWPRLASMIRMLTLLR